MRIDHVDVLFALDKRALTAEFGKCLVAYLAIALNRLAQASVGPGRPDSGRRVPQQCFGQRHDSEGSAQYKAIKQILSFSHITPVAIGPRFVARLQAG
ncbi:hypothetical protein D9M71_626280 [compost metagenome]